MWKTTGDIIYIINSILNTEGSKSTKFYKTNGKSSFPGVCNPKCLCNRRVICILFTALSVKKKRKNKKQNIKVFK